MRLNVTKCIYGVESGTLLGYLMTRRGIEAFLSRSAILELLSPTTIKAIQENTGRVAVLNRFISQSSDKCNLFYIIIKKNKKYKPP